MLSTSETVVRGLRELALESALPVHVNGHCMAPLLESGATVQVIRQRFYWPGDVVVVHAPGGGLLSHRLLGCYSRSGQLRWLTQADSALWPDSAVPTERIIGKVCSGQCSPLLVRVPFTHRLKALTRFCLYGFFLLFSHGLRTKHR